ncbi:hypothetical protein GOP47_0017634 [Adiantum capillus-veneris]|uniref:Uncharacterized protein n=1 Tax=Adiantum capillus-veneris TaxID=13818 RepID=A0A9D4ZBZ1_ADICA|nr:hypothetical protein GOP47_0017634 [Adiantum capillus-veneris]
MAISLANNVCAFVAPSSKCSSSPRSAGFVENRRRWCRGWRPTRDARNLGVRVESPSDGRDSSSSVAVTTAERSEADRLVDGMSFGELCDEFQCISSPAVEATARQLARDILELREGNRALGTFAISVKYKDPLRSFTGRDKYKRPSWIAGALDKPSVAVREMVMQSTSVLIIKWVLRGKPKIPGPELVLAINDTFTLNQISGQVVEHVQEWDLSRSSPIAQAYFWASRLAYSSVESGKDASEAVQGVSKLLEKNKDGDKETYYRDPTDPTKFFQIDENPQRDIYQIGLFIALIYLLVQFLKATL